MSAKLGLERPSGVPGAPNFILYGFSDPATEILQDSMTPLAPVDENGVQIWKITHNGVDTHPVHFHLFDVQLINRVGWDGFIRTPDDNELGWKDTVRVSPLEDTIVALRPVAPQMNFGLPDSMRPLNPMLPIGSTHGLLQHQPGHRPALPGSGHQPGRQLRLGVRVALPHPEPRRDGHDAADDARVARSLAASPSLAATGVPGAPIDLRWTDSTPGDNPAMLGNPANEIGFRLERATVDSLGVESTYTVLANPLANVTSYEDTTTAADTAYRYRVIALNAAGEAMSNTVTVGPLLFFTEYTITPTAGMGGAIDPSAPTTVAAGSDSPTFTITPSTGFTLADVLVDGVSIGATSTYQFTGVANDHTIWALFAPDTYQIVPSAGPNGSISADTTQTVTSGSDTTFTITPDAGYHVALLTVDGVKVPSTETATRSRTCRPTTDRRDLRAGRVHHHAERATRAASSRRISRHGCSTATDSATYTLTPDPGFHIKELVIDGASIPATDTYKFTNVIGAHTIHAVFEPDPRIIVPSAGAHGSISPDTTQTVPYGSDATFTITPDVGYHIATLKVDGVTVPNAKTYTFRNVVDDHTIAVTFAIDTFAITPSAGANGAITPSTVAWVNYGADSATYTLTPNPGYYVSQLVVDGVNKGSIKAYKFTNVKASHTISANLRAQDHRPIQGQRVPERVVHRQARVSEVDRRQARRHHQR